MLVCTSNTILYIASTLQVLYYTTHYRYSAGPLLYFTMNVLYMSSTIPHLSGILQVLYYTVNYRYSVCYLLYCTLQVLFRYTILNILETLKVLY